MSKGQTKKACNTRYSQPVTHASTDRAQRCLTSVIGREPVFPTWYGRRRPPANPIYPPTRQCHTRHTSIANIMPTPGPLAPVLSRLLAGAPSAHANRPSYVLARHRLAPSAFRPGGWPSLLTR